MTIIDCCKVAWRARLIILVITVVAVATAALVLRFQPKVFTAGATILTPKEPSSQSRALGSLGTLMGGSSGRGGDGGISLPSLLASGPSLSTNQDMVAAILRSRSSRVEVVGELARKYGAGVGSQILNVEVSLRDKGIIAVAVESTDAVLSAEAANLYFEVLDRFLERLTERANRRQEKFYADQLQRAAKEVAAAEEAILKFQAENRVTPLETTTRVAVDTSADLRGTIMALELQREVLRMRITDQHPQMRELEKQIAELKKQYAKNLFGAPMDLPGGAPGQGRKEFFVSTEKKAPVDFAHLKLYRNLKIQEAFYTGALQSLENLRYSGDLRQLLVEPLDPAVPSTSPTRPRVLQTLLMAGVGGVLLSLLAVGAIEYIRQLRRQNRTAPSRPARHERRPDVLGPLAPSEALMEPDPFSAAGRSRQ